MLVFLESRDDRDEAWETCRRYADLIRGSDLWHGLGVTVRPMRTSRGLAYGIYLGKI